MSNVIHCSYGGMRIENMVLIINCARANIDSTRAYTWAKKMVFFRGDMRYRFCLRKISQPMLKFEREILMQV